MPEEIQSTADPFEIIRSTRSMPVEAGPGAERTDPKDPGGVRACAERRQHAALAVSGSLRSEDQRDDRGLLQTRLGRAGRATVPERVNPPQA